MTQTKDPITELDHDNAFMLLPWHVNESLAGTEAIQVRAHLAICAVCQREVATLASTQRIVASADESLPEPAPEMLDRVLNRIEDYEAARRQQSASVGWSVWLNALWFAWPTWGRLAFVGQFAVLLVLAMALVFAIQRARHFGDQAAQERLRADHNEQLLKQTERRYETLTGPDKVNGAQGVRLNVAFQESATEREIREL